MGLLAYRHDFDSEFQTLPCGIRRVDGFAPIVTEREAGPVAEREPESSGGFLEVSRDFRLGGGEGLDAKTEGLEIFLQSLDIDLVVSCLSDSSGVVRMRVTCGLCSCIRRPR